MKILSRTDAAPLVGIVAPSAAMVAGLLSPLAAGAPGDLDPTFGDVGRVTGLPDLTGDAWAVQSETGDDAFFAGVDDYCGYYTSEPCEFDGFAGRLADDGSLADGFVMTRLQDVGFRDIALQPDGRVVAVGSTRTPSGEFLTVVRLNSDGTPDATFADAGTLRLDDTATTFQTGRSAVIAPDGRITVAGTDGNGLVVLRLLEDGQVDSSFGSTGIFGAFGAETGPGVSGPAPRIVRVSSGAYRVMVNLADWTSGIQRCAVLGLTPTGEIDAAFGEDGFAAVARVGSEECVSIVTVSDDRVVVAGNSWASLDEGGGAFAHRFLADGSLDQVFDGHDVTANLSSVTAISAGTDDSLTLAGWDREGRNGSLLVRLGADGTLDATFASGGLGWVDLPHGAGWTATRVNGIDVLDDHEVLLAGSIWSYPGRPAPFVARLLGDSGGGSAGVLGIERPEYQTSESEREARVVVRRTGGRSGAVSVRFQTVAVDGTAIPGTDFVPVEGRLDWADGDDSERVVVVPIIPDSNSEAAEQFLVTIGDADGSAGIGSSAGFVTIRSDSYPAGEFVIALDRRTVYESAGPVMATVFRNDYSVGVVSVTLTVASATATAGDDYELAVPVTLTWADGDAEPKRVSIAIRKDGVKEGAETISLALTTPTGGATLNSGASTATLTISDDPKRDGGGGGAGFTTLLLLAAAWLRRCLGGSS